MTLGAALTAFTLTFLYVALRSWQQINVVTGRYLHIIPVSLAMGLSDVAIILLIVKTNSIALGFVNGVGGGCGACLAMYLNRRSTVK